MTPLTPILMFGWIPLTMWFFGRYAPHKAVLLSVVGGTLFLPWTSFDVPGLPEYNKIFAIGISVFIGRRSAHQGTTGTDERWHLDDALMFTWCFLVPIATAASNRLGAYYALSSMVAQYFGWGVFYWIGKKHFTNDSAIFDLAKSIVIGGILYVPLILFELRMSPQLSNMVYGFFPHSFAQHFRYGGYRPVVFMQHGLMVSLWMAVSATVALWLWVHADLSKVLSIPMWLAVPSIAASCVLCKSANGWTFLALGLASVAYSRVFPRIRVIKLLLLLGPLYICIRLSNIVPAESIEQIASRIFDAERIHSLSVRLRQEILFGTRAMERPLFGWGGWGRGWPVDPVTGDRLVNMVDALFVIVFSTNGGLGLVTLYGSLMTGPWLVLRFCNKASTSTTFRRPITMNGLPIVLTVTFFAVDTLLNSMINPIYLLCAGALVGYVRGKSSQKSKDCTMTGSATSRSEMTLWEKG